MAISVNKETCIGCGACVSLCPKAFQLNAEGKCEPLTQEDPSCAGDASEACPVQAITVN